MPKQKRNDLCAALLQFVKAELEACADSKKAVEMAAYMKTSMPFYGVQKPQRLPIIRQFKEQYAASDFDSYRDSVLCLWRRPHREEKYLAINYAEAFPEFISSEALSLYEQLIREGAWWDFVDPVAINLVGEAYLQERRKLKPEIEKWSTDDDLWMRRASIICQLHHKDDTDEKQLYKLCSRLSHEKEFFIQKAIGWALREHAKTAPESVAAYLKENAGRLAPLSFREASKHLQKEGLI